MGCVICIVRYIGKSDYQGHSLKHQNRSLPIHFVRLLQAIGEYSLKLLIPSKVCSVYVNLSVNVCDQRSLRGKLKDFMNGVPCMSIFVSLRLHPPSVCLSSVSPYHPANSGV